jgi:hypothetical protein
MHVQQMAARVSKTFNLIMYHFSNFLTKLVIT